MKSHESTSSENLDALTRHLAEQDRISAVHHRAHYEARALVENLVGLARIQGISASDISEYTGGPRESIVSLEHWNGDPKLSTILRYAEAAGYRVEFTMKRRESEEG